MTDRTTQLNALFKEEIARFFGEEVPEVFVTVTRVQTSPDLHAARVWVSFLNNRGSGLEELSKHLHDLGHTLGKRLRLKRTPHIQLMLDTGMEYSEHISEILQESDTDSQG